MTSAPLKQTAVLGNSIYLLLRPRSACILCQQISNETPIQTLVIHRRGVHPRTKFSDKHPQPCVFNPITTEEMSQVFQFARAFDLVSHLQSADDKSDVF